MRYLWVELINYAGIYNGMGLNQIKIDFTKCKSNKIIIRGNNGSGKSTLMNAINPNPDSNDCFIPGSEARKNIGLLDGSTEYIIRYIHPVTNSGRGTTKAYISKSIDGQMVEMNPNGNVTSCKDFLYSEFNLDSNYLSLASLSSENRGLVDSRPAERKKLVNSIIHTLESYNQIYKKLSKKAGVYKESIASLSRKINDLGNEVTINVKLKNVENRITSLENERNTTLEAIAAVKIKISEYVKILKDNNYDQTVSELKEINTSIKSLTDSVNKQLEQIGIKDRSSLDSFLEYINNEITKLETKLEADTSQIPVLLTQAENESADLNQKRERLNSLQSDYNYTDLVKLMNETKANINQYESIFQKMKLKNIDLITADEFDSAMESLKELKDLAYALTSNYTQEDLIAVYQGQYINREEYKSTVDYTTKILLQISDLQKEYAIYESNRSITSELKNRPEGCIIDDCPYIAAAVKANKEYPENKMKEIKDSIDSLSSSVAQSQDLITKTETYYEIIDYESQIKKELKKNMRFIKKLPVSNDFEETFLTRVTNLDQFKDIDDLYAYVDCGNMLEEYKIAKQQLVQYENEYKVYESKNEIIESIISDVDSINTKLDNIRAEIDDTQSKVKSESEQLDNFNNIKTKVTALIDLINTSLIPAEEKRDELSTIKQTLDDNTSELNGLNENLGDLTANLNSINSDIQHLSEEKEKLSHSLLLLADYTEELNKYQTDYKKIDKIRYYSSSSTGIQTVYMQLYMNKIISTANNLLSLLFDGEFVLQPFVINDQEFRIPCLGNGLIHDDISSMSTAQKSMISLILSFSILNQSATRYNILFLDEMDGGLDTSNRSYFITLLDKLMNMLQCEQCFIVSHNNELNTDTADLIILKSNSNEQYSGNVIWKY